MFPYIRLGYQDQDNFVRNLVTVLFPYGIYSTFPVVQSALQTTGGAANVVQPAPQDLGDPILSTDEMKVWCHIEPDQDEDDDLLTTLEIAARLHTQNVLRKLLDPVTVGANIKQAMLLLVAHWYRNRESVSVIEMYCVPQAYEALLSPERSYPLGVY